MDNEREQLCWLLCLDFTDQVCIDLLRQVAEQLAGGRFGARCFAIQSLAQTVSWRKAGYPSSLVGAAQTSARVDQLLTVPSKASLANRHALQHIHQAACQTETRLAALEQQLIGPGRDADDARSASRPATWRSGSQMSKQYFHSLGALMDRSASSKRLSRSSAHTQCLQASWPLSVAPSPEQQAAAFAKTGRKASLLQTQEHPCRVHHVRMRRLQLANFQQPAFASASALAVELDFWQKVVEGSVSTANSATLMHNLLVIKSEQQQGEVTALQASPDAMLLAVGGVSGVLTILSMHGNNIGVYLEGPQTEGSNNQTGSRALISLAWCECQSGTRQHVVSMSSVGQINVWAILQADSASQPPSAALRSRVLQRVFDSTLDHLTADATAVAATPLRLKFNVSIAFVACPQQQGDDRCLLWAPAPSNDIMCIDMHLQSVKKTNAKAQSIMQRQTAQADNAHHLYHGHQAQIEVVACLEPGKVVSVDAEGHILQWDPPPGTTAWHLPTQHWALPTHISLLCPRGPATQQYPPGRTTAPFSPEALLSQHDQWVTSYITQPSSPGLLLKQTLHAPMRTQDKRREACSLLLSQYDAKSKQLLAIHSQPAVEAGRPLRVVGGQQLPGRPDQLLLVTSASTTDAQSIVNPLHLFCCQVINLRHAKMQGPRIDIWDSSSGQHRPVFTVQAGHTALGGQFLWCHLAAHQLACYSLLTGQQVAELSVSGLPLQAVPSSLQLIRVKQHVLTLVVGALGCGHVACIQLDETAAVEAALAARFEDMQVDSTGMALDLSESSLSSSGSEEGANSGQTDSSSENSSARTP